MPAAYGRDSKPLLWRWQTDFNTPQTAADGSFVALPVYPSQTPGSRRDLYDDKRLGDGRNPGLQRLGFETADGQIEVPLLSQSIGWHLTGLLGLPVTTGAGPYVHTFSSGGAIRYGTAGSVKAGVPFATYGVIHNSMELRIARQSQTQRARFGLLARNEVKLAADLDATPVVYADADDKTFAAFDGLVKVDGADVAEIRDLSITCANGRETDGDAPSGAPWVKRMLEGDFAVTGQMRLSFEDATWYDRAASGTEFDLELSWAQGGDSMVMTIRNVIGGKFPAPLEAAGLLTVTMPVTASRPPSGQPAVTVVLTNGLASYGNPA